MKEQFHKIIGYISKAIIFIVIPFSGIAAIIYYAFTKLSSVRQELSRKEMENKLMDSILKKEQAKNEADRAVDDYKSTRDKYLSEHDDK